MALGLALIVASHLASFVHSAHVSGKLAPVKPAFLALWLAWPIAFWLGVSYTDYSNHINWAYSFGLLAFGMFAFPHRSPVGLLMYDFAKDVRSLGTLLFLIGLYFLAFYVVSFWELYPGTTIEWGKFEMVQFAVAANGYVLGRVFKEETILKLLHYMGVVLVAMTVIQFAVDREAIRYGYGTQLMLCLPASVLLRKYWFVAVALAVMAVSRHKTPLACALLAVTITYVFAKVPSTKLTVLQYHARASAIVVCVPLAIASLVLFAPELAEEFSPAIARVLPEDTTIRLAGVDIQGEERDIVRDYQIEASKDFLGEHLPQGIGYMNFLVLTGIQTSITANAGRDKEYPGISLHNSFMTWILEGGVLVSFVVLLLFWRVWARISWLRQTPSRNFAVMAIAWCAALLFLGVFHQVHQSMQFWATIGLIFGYYDRHKLPNAVRYQTAASQ